MKTMRYRIRVIALVLICSLLVLLLWNARLLWVPLEPSPALSPVPESDPADPVPSIFPPANTPGSPWDTPAVSSPLAVESPSGLPAESPMSPEMTVTPEPLYDVYGL